MEEFLRIIEKPSSSEIKIDSDRLKIFNKKLKIWDYANVFFEEYQKLSLGDQLPILRNYYSEMYFCLSGVFLSLVWLGFFMRQVSWCLF